MRTKKNNKIVMVDERKKEQKGFSKKKKKARTAQDTIPFDEVYENGLFRMDETFSILFMYDNIDYKVMRDDEKTAFYEKYMHFLNTLPQDVQYQELILNYPTNREMLESAMIPKQENQICSRAVYHDYCHVMEGIINVAANQSCEQVILAAMSFTPRTKLDNVGILFKHFKTLQDEALAFSVRVTQLLPDAALEKLHHLCHMTDKEPFLLPTNFLQCDVNLKDYIAPASFTFKSKYIEITFFKIQYAEKCDSEKFLYVLIFTI
ncbi:MAG: hypothetical protein ABS987_09415, partial [Ruminococcus sp.]